MKIPLPLPFASGLRNIVGVDDKGCPRVLKTRPKGLLYSPDGRVAASWHDGSENQPIHLPDLQVLPEAASQMMVTDEAGMLYRLIPENTEKKQRLVYEAGAIYFEPIGKSQNCFNAEDIESNGKCDFEFAVFSGCTDGAGILCLKRATRDELFPPPTEEGCEDFDTDGYDGISMVRVVDGVVTSTCVKPSCNKVIESCCPDGSPNPKWRIVDRKLGFEIFDTPITVLSGVAAGTHNAVLPSYPSAKCGKVAALLRVSFSVSLGPSAAFTRLTVTHNGEVIARSDAPSTDVVEATVLANEPTQTFLISKSGTGAATATVKLIGYFS